MSEKFKYYQLPLNEKGEILLPPNDLRDTLTYPVKIFKIINTPFDHLKEAAAVIKKGEIYEIGFAYYYVEPYYFLASSVFLKEKDIELVGVLPDDIELFQKIYQPHPHLVVHPDLDSLEGIIKLVKNPLVDKYQLKMKLEERGRRFLWIAFEGKKMGSSFLPRKCIEHKGGNYRTVAYGILEYFCTSTLSPGEIFEHEGKKFMVLRNSYSPGDGWIPDFYAFYAVELFHEEEKNIEEIKARYFSKRK